MRFSQGLIRLVRVIVHGDPSLGISHRLDAHRNDCASRSIGVGRSSIALQAQKVFAVARNAFMLAVFVCHLGTIVVLKRPRQDRRETSIWIGIPFVPDCAWHSAKKNDVRPYRLIVPIPLAHLLQKQVSPGRIRGFNVVREPS